MTDTEICFLPAVRIVELIRSKQLSCRELMEIQLKQIEKVNPKVNAIVTLLQEKGLKDAGFRKTYRTIARLTSNS